MFRRNNESSRFSRVWKTAVAVAATAGLALTGCAGGGEAGDGSAELGKLTVLSFLPLESFTFTPEMYAAAGGYFEKHGLDVDLRSVQGTSAAIQSVIGGAADITRVSSIDAFPALELDQPLTAVGTMAHQTNLRIASSSENPIESTDDMVGETVGLGSSGGTSEKTLDLALHGAGVAAEEVNRQTVPVTAATYELIQQQQLGGYIVSLDTSIAIEQMNPDAVVSTAELDTVPDIQTWLVADETLEDPDKSEKTTAFLAAIREATQAVIDDAPNGYSTVLQEMRDSGEFQFAALDDDEIARAALDQYTAETWQAEGFEVLENDHEGWAEAYDFYAEGGLISGDRDPSEWMTDELLPTS